MPRCSIMLCLLGLIFNTTACQAAERVVTQEAYYAADDQRAVGALMEVAPSPAPVAPAASASLSVMRQIIYSAQLRMEVKNFDAASEQIKSLVEAAGGFMASSTVDRSSSDRRSGTLEIRVPKDRFTDVLNQCKALGAVKEEGVHGQDVTEEYTDLEARLSNARRLEMRLIDLLEQHTNALKDMLEVEKELGRVREEIERFEGRKRFLDDRITLSSITVHLAEPYTYTTSIFDPLKDAWSRAGGLLVSSVAVLLTVLIGGLPWLVVGGAIFYFLLRRLRRWRKKRTDL